MTNWNDETDRLIFLSKLHAGNSNETQYNHQMTTVFYPDEQISSYHPTVMTTTPMNGKLANRSTAKLSTMALKSTALPPNHKQYYSQVLYNRNDIEHVPHVRKSSELKSRTFFTTYDDDYEDGQTVNSIQDIIDQGNDYDNEFGGVISSSMPFSHSMKVAGTYRREKKKRDFVNSIEASNSEHIPFRDNEPIKNIVTNANLNGNDPFSKFKPISPADVNRLVANQQLKFIPYALHKPRPLTTATNPYFNDYFDTHDPHFVYHQVIAASNSNRDITPKATSRFEKPVINQKQKPFSLMLDVYPMADDEQQSSIISTTRHSPYKRPHYPVNTNAINQLQPTYYSHMKFPQLQQYRVPYLAQSNNPNDIYFRKYMLNRIGPQAYQPPASIARQPTYSPIDLTNTNAPSQITVHLNLYPNRKRSQARNVEILDMGDQNESDDATKRHENNFTNLHLQETQSNGKYYIPPFSAIKINSLQPQFNVNVTQSTFDLNLLNHELNGEQSSVVSPKSKPFETNDAITVSTIDANIHGKDMDMDGDDIKTTSIIDTDSKTIRFPN